MQIIDQLGRDVKLVKTPQKIISLCPSVTETLAELVAHDKIIGCTSYCKYPSELIECTTIVGGTKTLNLEAIRTLNPDLILSVREENDERQILALSSEFSTVILDPVDRETMLESIGIIGQAVNEKERSKVLKANIQQALSSLKKAEKQKVFYLIWRKPYMCAGKGTFINSIIEALGFVNAVSELEGRYPELKRDMLEAVKPDIILAASEPFPFEQKYIPELEAYFKGCQIHLVDGEAFSWHGVRMIESVNSLNALVASL